MIEFQGIFSKTVGSQIEIKKLFFFVFLVNIRKCFTEEAIFVLSLCPTIEFLCGSRQFLEHYMGHYVELLLFVNKNNELMQT